MDIQEEREFNETMSLVKAVLERLEFHAFEDVLIWSNEHASKALLRCLKKTLSEFENGHLVLTNSYPKLKHFSVDSVVKGLLTTLDQAQERQDSLNKEIDELSDQLAKAKAVPEGFVLVPREPTEDMLGAAWETPPAGGPSSNRRVFYEKQSVVYKAMVDEAEKAMIEAAQEPTHESK